MSMPPDCDPLTGMSSMDDVACAAAEVTPQRPVPHIYQLLTEPVFITIKHNILNAMAG